MITPCNVAVIGFGMVGKETVRILKERSFPMSSLKIFARTKRQEMLDGENFDIDVLENEDDFNDIQIALFAGTEGEKGASVAWGWKAIEKGAVVIDNGNDFRMDERVPLVVPEVNSDDIRKHQGFIANPNCSTIQMVVALAPIHRKFGIERVIVSTYQAVSGSGTSAVLELKNQVDNPEARSKCSVYPHPIFSNAMPEIGSQSKEYSGYTTEEVKMLCETRKILHAPKMQISATCVRVPVFNAHSESIHIQLNKKADIEDIKKLLKNAPGIIVSDDIDSHKYPLAQIASGRDDVYVGRIRKSTSHENAFDLWCVADNIRKGAALNAVQIAEKLIE